MTTRLLGHRGASVPAPENTAAAIRLALAHGAEGVEIDVRALADGSAVLMHDADVGRTTDGEGALAAMSADDVAQLDAGGWKSPEFVGEAVPRLDDVLAEFLGKAYLALEMKEILPEPVLDAIGRAYRDHLGAELVLASFDARALERARDVAPAVPRTLILGPKTPFPPAELIQYLGLTGLFAPDPRTDERLVIECRRAGLSPTVYTVNDPGRAEVLAALGVEGIISDDPKALRPHLRRPDEVAG